jgi:hypothetical protein
LRDLLAGEDKESGANGESIPAEEKVARGREVIPGHLLYRPPSQVLGLFTARRRGERPMQTARSLGL